MKSGATDHPKMNELADWIDTITEGSLRRLGVDPLSVAIGAMEQLWQWCAKYTPAGDVGRYSDARIAQAAGWSGDATAFVQALVRVGWLDADPEHRLLIHDWSEHCEDSVHARLARKREWFADGTRPSLAKLSSDEKAEAKRWFDSDAKAVAASGARRRPSAPGGGLPVPLPLPKPLGDNRLVSNGRSPLPPTAPVEAETEKANRRDAVSAGVQGDQPGEDSAEVVQSQGNPVPERNSPVPECPDWCEPELWREAERLTELIESADHPEPAALSDREGVSRVVHVARTLQDAGRATVLALAPEGIARVIEQLFQPPRPLTGRLAEIAANLRKYPNGTYPNLDGTGRRRNPSMLEEAHRLLTMGDKLLAPERRRGSGFRRLTEA